MKIDSKSKVSFETKVPRGFSVRGRGLLTKPVTDEFSLINSHHSSGFASKRPQIILGACMRRRRGLQLEPAPIYQHQHLLVLRLLR